MFIPDEVEEMYTDPMDQVAEDADFGKELLICLAFRKQVLFRLEKTNILMV